MVIIPIAPSLKSTIAGDIPISNIFFPTKIYFGSFFLYIIKFKASLLFCVFPCKHLLNSSSVLIHGILAPSS